MRLTEVMLSVISVVSELWHNENEALADNVQTTRFLPKSSGRSLFGSSRRSYHSCLISLVQYPIIP